MPFLVGKPLMQGLEKRAELEVIEDLPRKLVAQLRCGSLDCALVSSIEAFRQAGYRAVAQLGIACEGEVGSVRLFLRCPAQQVKSLALDHGSETSVALAKLILTRRYAAEITTNFDIEPTLLPDEVDADAVLLIGDFGLRADPGSRAVLDLGQEWKDWKDLPFVFALWLFRPGATNVRVISEILRQAWLQSKVLGFDDGTGGRIQYELGSRHMEGLVEFQREAVASGLCEPGLSPRWLGEAASFEALPLGGQEDVPNAVDQGDQGRNQDGRNEEEEEGLEQEAGP